MHTALLLGLWQPAAAANVYGDAEGVDKRMAQRGTETAMGPRSVADLGSRSRVFRADAVPVQHRPNGGTGRNLGQGRLVTGEEVAVHASSQPAGATPNPAHRIQHTEFICLCEGALEFLHDGKVERAEAGDVLLVAFGTMHGVRNVGTGPARYFVVAVGGDTNQ